MPRITITEPGKNPQPYRFDLATNQVKIGRRSENEIVIECGSVSGSHAIMTRVPGGFELSDLGSTNGITREGDRIEKWLLTDGDKLLLGDVVFDFQLIEEELATLADEIPHAHEKAKTKAKAQPERASSPRVPAAFFSSGPSGRCLVIASLVLGLFAFYKGLSIRHENETGMALGQRLTTSDSKTPAAGGENEAPAAGSNIDSTDTDEGE